MPELPEVEAVAVLLRPLVAGARITAAKLASLLSASKRPLKLFLTGQAKLAGVGNIYANEALWHARLDPRRLAKRVRAVEARRLHKAIVGVLRRALKCCLEPAPDLSNPNWWFPGIETILRVYGREGKPCYRDRTPIQRIRQGGQSTFFCPKCQK
jgi:formamidopyrimidine-DNA glycosylase